jgi:hypothetical protein
MVWGVLVRGYALIFERLKMTATSTSFPSGNWKSWEDVKQLVFFPRKLTYPSISYPALRGFVMVRMG